MAAGETNQLLHDVRTSVDVNGHPGLGMILQGRVRVPGILFGINSLWRSRRLWLNVDVHVLGAGSNGEDEKTCQR